MFSTILTFLFTFQDSEDIFPFQPIQTINQNVLAQRVSNYMQQQDNATEGAGTQKKKKENEPLYSYIKRSKQGKKIVRLEVYDAENIENIQTAILCKCNADVCMQYVVDNDNMYFDDVYNSVKSLMTKIQNSIVKM